MPAMSGQLRWACELKGKMSFSVKSFKELNHPICYREGAKLVFKKYKDTMGQLTTYEDDVFQMWNLGISKKLVQSLNRSLLIRNTDKGTLKVNFARELSSLLREVSTRQIINIIFSRIQKMLNLPSCSLNWCVN